MNNTSKPNLLFMVQLPPPLHGVANVNQQLLHSKAIQELVNIDVLPIAYNKQLADMSHNGINKAWLFVLYFFRLLLKLIFNRPRCVYFTIAPLGVAFIRDSILVALIKLFRIPLVYHLHGKGIDNHVSGYKKHLYQFVFKNSKVICLSKQLAKDIQKVKQNADILICANGVDDPGKETMPKREGEELRLLFFSNLIPSKGIKMFLDLCQSLHANGYSFKAEIAGEYSAKYTAQDLGNFFADKPELVTKVAYLGPLVDKNKLDCFERADVFILPSLNDAFPLVILEAMSSHCALVCSDQGAIPEMLAEESGLVFPSGDKQALYQAVSHLLQSPQSLHEFKQKSRRRFLAHYTSEHFEQRMRNILSRVLEK